ncbi:hypothetical protein A0H81_11444 [Grifola frondosa]|uniref:Uncharacterized protein n=1 Tax=Grifola frondosa TaxID=5627 RepID=A0A1C7LWT0_GRIFR|nr:hypothetical protein A0H81_11444 [Grifola frondosa]
MAYDSEHPTHGLATASDTLFLPSILRNSRTHCHQNGSYYTRPFIFLDIWFQVQQSPSYLTTGGGLGVYARRYLENAELLYLELRDWLVPTKYRCVRYLRLLGEGRYEIFKEAFLRKVSSQNTVRRAQTAISSTSTQCPGPGFMGIETQGSNRRTFHSSSIPTMSRHYHLAQSISLHNTHCTQQLAHDFCVEGVQCSAIGRHIWPRRSWVSAPKHPAASVFAFIVQTNHKGVAISRIVRNWRAALGVIERVLRLKRHDRLVLARLVDKL